LRFDGSQTFEKLEKCEREEKKKKKKKKTVEGEKQGRRI